MGRYDGRGQQAVSPALGELDLAAAGEANRCPWGLFMGRGSLGEGPSPFSAAHLADPLTAAPLPLPHRRGPAGELLAIAESC